MVVSSLSCHLVDDEGFEVLVRLSDLIVLAVEHVPATWRMGMR
jgi:hypothetical protein